MKFTIYLLVLFSGFKADAQQYFRINDFPRIFKGAIPNTFDKKINDTVTLHGVYKNPNYQFSLIASSGTVLCSCLYSVSGTMENSSTSDSTIQRKVLIPVSDNCLKRYRTLVDRKYQ